MAELPQETINRIRHSGRVHSVEDFADKNSDRIIIKISEMVKIVERLEK